MKVKAKISISDMRLPWEKRKNKDIGVIVFDMTTQTIHAEYPVLVTITILENVHDKK